MEKTKEDYPEESFLEESFLHSLGIPRGSRRPQDILLVHGLPGIGKTTLLERWNHLAEQAGFEVAWISGNADSRQVDGDKLNPEKILFIDDVEGSDGQWNCLSIAANSARLTVAATAQDEKMEYRGAAPTSRIVNLYLRSKADETGSEIHKDDGGIPAIISGAVAAQQWTEDVARPLVRAVGSEEALTKLLFLPVVIPWCMHEALREEVPAQTEAVRLYHLLCGNLVFQPLEHGGHRWDRGVQTLLLERQRERNPDELSSAANRSLEYHEDLMKRVKSKEIHPDLLNIVQENQLWMTAYMNE